MRYTNNEIRAVLFDFGETLVTFGKVNINTIFAKSAKLTYKFLQSRHQPVGNFRHYSWRNLAAIRFRYLLSKLTGSDFDTLLLLKKIGKRKKYNLDENQWRQLAWLWYEPLSKLTKTEPDIIDTLTKLKDLGLALAIVSNTFIHSSALDRHLEQLGLLGFFEFRLYSYEVNFRKPDTRIFKIASDRIGQKPANILFVGDRIDNDIKPALKLGMKAALKSAYTNAAKPAPVNCWKIDRLAKLPRLIQEHNRKTQSVISQNKA